MNDLRTAAQMALEALTNCTSEHGHRCNRCDSEVDEGHKVIDALRAALAAEPQPVAWLWYERPGRRREHLKMVNVDPPPERAFPVYTAAPTTQPLTDERIHYEWRGFNDPTDGPISLSDFEAVARAIERAHGIGGAHG